MISSGESEAPCGSSRRSQTSSPSPAGHPPPARRGCIRRPASHPPPPAGASTLSRLKPASAHACASRLEVGRVAEGRAQDEGRLLALLEALARRELEAGVRPAAVVPRVVRVVGRLQPVIAGERDVAGRVAPAVHRVARRHKLGEL